MAVSFNSVLLEYVWTWGVVPKSSQSFSNHCLRKPWPQCQHVIHSFHSTHKLRPEGHFLRLSEQDAEQLVAILKRHHILAVSYLFLHLSSVSSPMTFTACICISFPKWMDLIIWETTHSRSGGKLQIYFSRCCILASGLIMGQMLCCSADGSQQCASTSTWIFAYLTRVRKPGFFL